MRQALDDGVGEGSTFDDLMRAAKLQPSVTPPLLASGSTPTIPIPSPIRSLPAVIRAGFTASPEDHDPQVVAASTDGSFAVVAIQKVIAPTPRPLAAIRKKRQQRLPARSGAGQGAQGCCAGRRPARQGRADGAGARRGGRQAWRQDRAVRSQALRSRRQAGAAAGGDGVQHGAQEGQAARSAGPLRLLHRLLDSIEAHDATGDTATMDKVRGEITSQIAPEQREQFLEAIRRDIAVKRNEAVIARLKAGYLNGTAAGS
ncbi:MAG: hypothetical protein WDN44_10445 [Sphingomonas sp.]